LPQQGKQLKNREASLEMARVGTRAFADDWPEEQYAQDMLTANGVPAFPRMQRFEQSTLKALLTKGAAYCKSQVKKAVAREQKAATAVATAAAKRARAAPAGGGSGGGNGGGSGSGSGGGGPQQKRARAGEPGDLQQPDCVAGADTPLSALGQGAVFGMGEQKLLQLSKHKAWATCLGLAKDAGNMPAIKAGIADIKAQNAASSGGRQPSVPSEVPVGRLAAALSLLPVLGGSSGGVGGVEGAEGGANGAEGRGAEGSVGSGAAGGADGVVDSGAEGGAEGGVEGGAEGGAEGGGGSGGSGAEGCMEVDADEWDSDEWFSDDDDASDDEDEAEQELDELLAAELSSDDEDET
jgi:hypothetical protein